MTRNLYLAFLLCFIANLSFSQTPLQTEHQFYFFKVWNFTKYHHPALASGTVNADTLFLRNLPLVDKIKEQQQFNQFVASFLEGLPEVKAKEKPAARSEKVLRNNVDHSWMGATGVKNKKKLDFIFKNRHTDTLHHYIPDVRYYGTIPNEPEYAYPDSENVPYAMRMLALAKLQGAVDYLFPHRYLMDENFDAVVKRSLPLFAGCGSRMEYERLLLEVTSTFDDTHAFKIIKQIKNKGKIFKASFFPPFSYSVFDDEIVVTDCIVPENCKEGGIRKGDVIVAINNKTVAAVVEEVSRLVSVSNRPTLRNYLSEYLNNLVWQSDEASFSLRVRRDGKESVKTVPFVSGKEPEKINLISDYLNNHAAKRRTDDGLDIIQDTIAYINIHETFRFIENTPDHLVDQKMDSLLTLAASQKGIIFDMREYPDWGGFCYTYILKKFGKLPHRHADYFEINKAEVGTYILNNKIETYTNATLKADGVPYAGKVVVIVDPKTLSMSEWHTMSLQHTFPQSITIGEQSAGADGDEKSLAIPGGYQVYFTGNAIFYQDGTPAQRKGVKIDRVIPLTKEAVLSGKDNLLEEAVRLIRE